MSTLHYPGNRVAAKPDHPLGPDLFGGHWLPKAAVYDSDADVTTVTMRPVPPAEMERYHDWRRHQARAKYRLIRLFGLSA
jgi:hypothetical protein